MKLVSTKLEIATIRACCHRNPSVSGTVLSSIDESYLYNDHSIEALQRIQKILRKTGEVPSWNELCEDPRMSEEARERLRKHKDNDIRSRKDGLRAVKTLNTYRQLRGMFTMAEATVSRLKRSKVDVDEVMQEALQDISTLRQVRSDDATIVKFGKGNNADGVVSGLLREDVVDFLPTGFSAFDNRNGGFGFGNMVTIGGTSGGGKSALASQLAINWSKMGEHVVVVPLEMSVVETTARLMANAAKLDVRSILHRKLSVGEKKKYKSCYKRFVTTRKENGGTFSLFKPKSDMTIEEIMACTYVMNPRIVIVDYISLLKGVDGDDQWQKLGAVARYCKIYAETHNIIVVLLCQVDDTGKIRYAQAIKEHSNYSWVFVSTKETREAEIINVHQLKARNGELYDFTLKANLKFMRIRSMTEEEMDTHKSTEATVKKTRREGSNSGKRSTSDPKYLKDTADD